MDQLVSWTRYPDDGVKYFSGTATYATTLDVPLSCLRPGAKVVIDLGVVKEIAEMSVNGKAVGGILWKPRRPSERT